MRLNCTNEYFDSIYNMSTEEEVRAAVLVALHAGRSPMEMVNFLKVPKSAVYRVAAKFKKSRDDEKGPHPARRKLHAQRSDAARNEHLFEKVQVRVEADPVMEFELWQRSLAPPRQSCTRL